MVDVDVACGRTGPRVSLPGPDARIRVLPERPQTIADVRGVS